MFLPIPDLSWPIPDPDSPKPPRTWRRRLAVLALALALIGTTTPNLKASGTSAAGSCNSSGCSVANGSGGSVFLAGAAIVIGIAAGEAYGVYIIAWATKYMSE